MPTGYLPYSPSTRCIFLTDPMCHIQAEYRGTSEGVAAPYNSGPAIFPRLLPSTCRYARRLSLKHRAITRRHSQGHIQAPPRPPLRASTARHCGSQSITPRASPILQVQRSARAATTPRPRRRTAATRQQQARRGHLARRTPTSLGWRGRCSLQLRFSGRRPAPR